eukprot:5465317-Prymnesium_polylepis.1
MCSVQTEQHRASKMGLFARTRLVHLPVVLIGMSLLRQQDGPARRRADGVALGLLGFNARRERRLQEGRRRGVRVMVGVSGE